MRLRHNPDPIRIVSQEQRDVWLRSPAWERCAWEDGRGRCRADGPVVQVSPGVYERRCPRHQGRL